MPEFIWFALIAGLAVAITAGPLGTFVVWQRLGYFGDTLAHSALLGVSLGLLLELNTGFTVIATSALLAVILVTLQPRSKLAHDSLLGILSHGALALGLVTLTLLENQRIDLNTYLFGDLLAIGEQELMTISAVSLLIFVVLTRFWDRLLSITVHSELAKVEGLPVERLRLILLLTIAGLVAVAMKVVGVLLITALLIIPASAARALSRSPEQMALLAGLLGAASVVGGVTLSLYADTPTGASVVVCALLIFLFIQGGTALRRGNN